MDGAASPPSSAHRGKIAVRPRRRGRPLRGASLLGAVIAAVVASAVSVHAPPAGADTDSATLVGEGGSSFVPAVRAIFESRFGAERLRSGNEFTSVARGLALAAAEFQ